MFRHFGRWKASTVSRSWILLGTELAKSDARLGDTLAWFQCAMAQ
jgi:hypothetical protein